MAHDVQRRQQARSLYIYERLDLSRVAERLNIARSTIAAWKQKSQAEGDDWDKSRSIAALGSSTVTQTLLQDYIILHQSTIEQLQNDISLSPLKRVQALSSLATSFQRTMNAAGKAAPGLSKLAMAQEVLKRLSHFITSQYPQHAKAFLEILEPFGQELTKSYG